LSTGNLEVTNRLGDGDLFTAFKQTPVAKTGFLCSPAYSVKRGHGEFGFRVVTSSSPDGSFIADGG
jgi:hypothetical protein